MKKKREKATYRKNQSPIALLAAFLGGVAVLNFGESLLGDNQGSGDPRALILPNWQVHAGSVCMGFATFVLFLFLLEVPNQRSKIGAWHLSWPWLPLVGVTGLASIVHIPTLALISVCLIVVVWAYLKTCKAWNEERNNMNTKRKP